MTQIGLAIKRLGSRITVGSSDQAGSEAKVRKGLLSLVLLAAVQAVMIQSALAQTRGSAVTFRYASFSPFIALLAGILILIMPRLLNFIVAVYLILVGLIGLFGV